MLVKESHIQQERLEFYASRSFNRARLSVLNGDPFALRILPAYDSRP